MSKLQFRLILTLFVLAAAGLACSMPRASVPTLPPTAAPITAEQSKAIEQQMQATLESAAPSGEVTITVTQEQLNGYLSAQMQNQTDQTITEPSVVLTEGHADLYAKVAQGGISAVAKAELQPRVDADGTVKLDVISINLGGLPVPDALKNQLADQVNSMLSNYLNQNGNPFKVTDIKVSEGQLSVTGLRQ